jgi:2-dehydro-3-deoxyphosphooctonate aldolase (KDO 8-P synthase)
MTANIQIGNLTITPDRELFLFAGPCVIESASICLDIANRLVDIARKTAVKIVFKASFDKANRSSISSFRGPGLEKGLRILADIRDKTHLPIMTDVHESAQVAAVGRVVDCIQIPAFLCRQTDLLVACAQTGKCVNVKKGQFLSPEEMTNVVEKLRASGCDNILLTERGTFFGYNRLVNDMTAIPAMKALGCPVVFDATHSTQRPGGLGNQSGGAPDLAPVLARSAVAAGADALFLEVHPDPKNALSDAACMLHIDAVESILNKCTRIFETVRS